MVTAHAARGGSTAARSTHDSPHTPLSPARRCASGRPPSASTRRAAASAARGSATTADAQGGRPDRSSSVGRSAGVRWPLAERANLVESLDAGSITPDDLEQNLADLARLAALPGGTSASLAAIRQLAPRAKDLSIVDVGAGRGDMAVAFARHGWRTVAVDSHPEVLRAATATARHALLEVVSGDGRDLPFGDAAFDIAHCSLLLHHLDPADAIAVIREMSRVARLGVVVNDLRRGVVPFVATGVTVALMARCRTTRVDGLISARRAYTLDELDELLAAARLRRQWRSMAVLPRVAIAAVAR